MEPARDSLGRPIADLRISVTDRCNMRCPYCMPREVFGPGFRFMSRAEVLTFEEIERVTRIFARLGVSKVRLTGGEPLLRRELELLIAKLAQIPGIADIAMTTNGTLLAARARSLARAGLGRATVSLDALDQRAFSSMSDTRVPLARVLAAIDSAHAAGLRPVKVNMVVRRAVNDHCVLAMAEHFRGRPQVLRFIEFMDVGETNEWTLADVVPGAEIVAAIDERWPLEAVPAGRVGEVAARWRYRDGAGEIGVIRSVSEPFCEGCTRARLSADGKVYTCLFASHGRDLRGLLRGGAEDDEIEHALRGSWESRADRYSQLRRDRGSQSARSRAEERDSRRVEMSYIGG